MAWIDRLAVAQGVKPLPLVDSPEDGYTAAIERRRWRQWARRESTMKSTAPGSAAAWIAISATFRASGNRSGARLAIQNARRATFAPCPIP